MTHHGKGRPLPGPGTGTGRNSPDRQDTAFVNDPLVPLSERLSYQGHRFRARGQAALAALLHEAAAATSATPPTPVDVVALALTVEEADRLHYVMLGGRVNDCTLDEVFRKLNEGHYAATGKDLREPWEYAD